MKALVVDDDFSARAGMVATLADLYPDARIHSAASVADAVSALAAAPDIDLVLLDLNLEGSRGIESLLRLKQWCEQHDSNPRIVILSAAADAEESLIPEAIDHCATGFIPKGTSIQVFKSAIDLTLAGAIYIPERYLASRRRAAASPAPTDGDVSFTRREREVAGLLVQGLTYKQIARRLSQPGGPLSDNTVRVHVQRMAWKLKVADDDSGKESLSAKAAVITAFAERRLKFGQGAA